MKDTNLDLYTELNGQEIRQNLFAVLWRHQWQNVFTSGSVSHEVCACVKHDKRHFA